ncbi:MAG: hypothetical protein JNK89_11595 [Saprospiraceae bacterium]|nr:hypothetical protein [Saprospiraceae bacterium]
MQLLLEVVQLLDRYQVRQIDVLTNPRSTTDSKEHRYYEFYSGLRDGRWQTEAEAAASFGMEADSKAFARLKKELLKRLQNSILFIDTTLPEFTDHSRAHLTLRQRWALAMTLWSRGMMRSFQEIAFELLQLASKYEFIDLAAEIAMYLKANIVTYPQLNQHYARIKNQHDEFRAALQAELAVREAYEAVILPLTSKKGYKKENNEIARKYSQELRPLAEQYQHIALQKLYRLLELYVEQFDRNWAAALQKARSARLYFKNKPFDTKHHQLAFSQQEIGCLIMLGRYAEAKEICAEVQPLANESIYNHFKTRELALVCELYAADYAEAWRHCKEVMRHPRFREISTMDQESWRLFYGYLCFLVKSKRLELSPREKGEVEKFRLGSWLNDLPLFSQDKRGANVPTLILQAMFLLLDGKLEAFDNRIEALRKYRQRNIDADEEHFRTSCFIRLLELVVRHGYQRNALQVEAEQLVAAMSRVSNDILDRSFEIEVVPYERQWEWIAAML